MKGDDPWRQQDGTHHAHNRMLSRHGLSGIRATGYNHLSPRH